MVSAQRQSYPPVADTSAEPAVAATHEPPARGALALIHCGLSEQSPQDVRKLPVKVNGFKPQTAGHRCISALPSVSKEPAERPFNPRAAGSIPAGPTVKGQASGPIALLGGPQPPQQ